MATSTIGTGTPSPRLGRSVAALLAGFVVVVVLSLVTDVALRALKIFPPSGQQMSSALFLLATLYRSAYGIAGSYITALLAPNRPMQHALLGGIVGFVLSIVGAVVTWNRADLGPHWYPLALVVTAIPCAWVGGWLRVRQLPDRATGLMLR